MEPKMTMEPEDGLCLDDGDDAAGGRSINPTKTTTETEEGLAT
jgi:hypothetical protein